MCLEEHTQPVSAVSDPWICHVGEPEAEAAKDGAGERFLKALISGFLLCPDCSGGGAV